MTAKNFVYCAEVDAGALSGRSLLSYLSTGALWGYRKGRRALRTPLGWLYDKEMVTGGLHRTSLEKHFNCVRVCNSFSTSLDKPHKDKARFLLCTLKYYAVKFLD